MKIGLEEFLELNVKELIAVNGGGSGSCSGSTGTGTGSTGVGTGTGSGGAGESPASSGSPSTPSGTSGGSGGSCSGVGGGQTKTPGGGTSTAAGTCSGTTQKGKENPGGGEPTAPAGDSTAGTCSGTTPKAKDDPTGGNPGLPAGGDTAGTCSGTTSSLTHQTPDDPNDYHCDINSYNVAVDQGIKNPGSWNGNKLGVNAIYTEYYSQDSTQSPEKGTRGYGFYDNNGDGTYDHMYFYDYRSGGSSYTVWNSDGTTAPTKQTWSINGTAVSHSVYVPLS